MSAAPTVAVVVLAYGAEPYLEPCVRSLLASEGVGVEAVLVDNGCTDGAVDRLEAEGLPGLIVVRPGANLGFAGGCNEGARHSTSDLVAFVNFDATVEVDTLARLADVAREPTVGIATASIRLADRPDRLNSAGNDIHFLGLSWSGRFDEPAASCDRREDVTGASGAGMMLRRQVWDRLGGFDPVYFMYHDDAELSWRCHMAGLRVVYVPDAVVIHRYEFTRNPQKLHLIERNRILMVLTCYSARMLILIAPALAALELGTLALAVAEGWWRQKLSAWWWLATNRRLVAARRRAVQASRVTPDRDLARLLVADIDPGNYRLGPAVRALNGGLRAYWRVARRLL